MTNKEEFHQEDSPRRQASARFIVDKDTASTDIREAMDTAHRSLSDSLQLSFRALQTVMFVLIVLYLVSGFKTIDEGETGVATVFGAVKEDKGLSPGLQLSWPSPIGGFEIFEAENRYIAIGNVFMPQINPNISRDQRISKSKSKDGLVPGRDGSLLTSDGDLAHFELAATWEIIDPVKYADAVPDAYGNVLVGLALERAAVHVVAALTLEELLDEPLEQLRDVLRNATQRELNRLDCGIHVADVSLPHEPEPPLFIQKSYSEFDSAKIMSETEVERATASAHEELIESAGRDYPTIVSLIEAYEAVVDQDDTEAAKAALAAIYAMLQSEGVTGSAANTISKAEGYRAEVETTLGRDYRRFMSLLPAYKEHPNIVIRDRWIAAYSKVFEAQDVETMLVPSKVAAMRLALRGSDQVAQLRSKLHMERREMRALLDDIDIFNPWILKAKEIDQFGPSRELSISGGRVRGKQR
ncbi:MAG: SPFH domain-containing protein [Phycisphaerales bacterium]|nr:SPFH domain-containing protein [Phycisphaerales bacterium]